MDLVVWWVTGWVFVWSPGSGRNRSSGASFSGDQNWAIQDIRPDSVFEYTKCERLHEVVTHKLPLSTQWHYVAVTFLSTLVMIHMEGRDEFVKDYHLSHYWPGFFLKKVAERNLTQRLGSPYSSACLAEQLLVELFSLLKRKSLPCPRDQKKIFSCNVTNRCRHGKEKLRLAFSRHTRTTV